MDETVVAGLPPGFDVVPSPPKGFQIVPEPRDMGQVGDMIRANLTTKAKGPEQVTGFLDALQAGLQVSVSGLIARGEAPSMQLGADAPWYSRAGANVGALAGDFPFMVGGALLGAGAGAPTGPGAAVTGMGGAFALPAALRSTLMDSYEHGGFQSFGDFWNRASWIMWETTKGWLTGAATGVAGGAARAVVPAGAARAVVPTAAELGAMVTVGSALEGHVPTAQEFIDGAIVLGGLKAASVLAPKLREIYAKTGKRPAEVVADAKTEPAIAADLASEKPMPDAYVEIARAERGRQIIPGEKAQAVAERPFADIPQATGEPAKPTHVNYNYINSTEDAKAALSRLSSVYEQEIQTQRRGTVTWEQTSQEAGKLLADSLGGVDQRLLMPREPGTAAGAAEILARKQLMFGAAEDMASRAREYLSKGTSASPEDAVQFLASIERTAMVQQEFLGARAEAGRALNILKQTAMDAKRARQIQDMLAEYKGDPAKLAEMVKELDNPASAMKFSKEAVKATTWQQVVEAWKAGLVSGPVTHAANIMGNGVFMAMRTPIDLVAAAIGQMRSSGERVAMAEPLARAIGNAQGAADGFRQAWHILKTGDSSLDGKAEQYKAAIPGKVGEVVRLPYRLLSAEDAVSRAMNERGEAYTLATRKAVSEGLSPVTREFRERIASLVQEPTPEMQKAISAAGERFTFNAPLGEKGQAIQQAVRKWHLEWAVPFIRTPSNIAKELARMTPFAPFMKDWRDAFKAGGVERDKALAELSTGTAVMSAVFAGTLNGTITGAGDPDPAKRRVQLAAGWQPYSIKIGDTFYSYSRLQPIGTLMGLAADIAETWDQYGDDERDETAKMLTVAFGNAVTNQTFLQGITNIVNATSDPTRFGPRLIQGLARSTVPNVVGQIVEMNDPYVREVDSMADAIRSRLPGLRQDLYPKRDIFGEPVEAKDRLAGILPITMQRMSDDKVRTEAARLNIGGPSAPKKVHVGRGSGKAGDVKLEPAERDAFATESGQFAHRILSEIVNDPSWDKLPDMAQRRIYQKVFTQANMAGAAAALPPDKQTGLISEIVQRIEVDMAPKP